MIEKQKHTVTFRGQPVEVIFEDHGHEADCNAHVIEWSFSSAEMNDLTLTDEEDQAVYDELLLVSELPEGGEPPSYDDPGRILVHYMGPTGSKWFQYEIEVLDHDSNSSVFFIQEGVGFDYWLDSHAEFTEPGYYVFEGITGQYIRGDYGEDDDETWEFTSMRPATADEISSGSLSTNKEPVA